jgi:hypothetical protein
MQIEKNFNQKTWKNYGFSCKKGSRMILIVFQRTELQISASTKKNQIILISNNVQIQLLRIRVDRGKRVQKME